MAYVDFEKRPLGSKELGFAREIIMEMLKYPESHSTADANLLASVLSDCKLVPKETSEDKVVTLKFENSVKGNNGTYFDGTDIDPITPVPQPKEKLYEVEDVPELGEGVRIFRFGNEYYLNKGEYLLSTNPVRGGWDPIKIVDKGMKYTSKDLT